MNIYKLKFTDKQQAENALKDITSEATVHVGKIVDIEGTYDDDGNEVTPPTFIDGWHVDIMIKENIDFGQYEVTPTNPRHKFFGQ
jgi:hypothetical protein